MTQKDAVQYLMDFLGTRDHKATSAEIHRFLSAQNCLVLGVSGDDIINDAVKQCLVEWNPDNDVVSFSSLRSWSALDFLLCGFYKTGGILKTDQGILARMGFDRIRIDNDQLKLDLRAPHGIAVVRHGDNSTRGNVRTVDFILEEDLKNGGRVFGRPPTISLRVYVNYIHEVDLSGIEFTAQNLYSAERHYA